MCKYKGVLFDLDGTLADTFGDIFHAANTLLQTKGYPLRSKDEILAAISFGRREFIKKIMPESASEQEVDNAVADYTAYYAIHFMDRTLPYPGMIELIHSLHTAGFRTAVVTNKAHVNAVQMVEQICPQGLVDGIWGLSTFPPKPDPSIALFAASTLGLEPSECVFVGDSELDMLTAKNAGMTPIGVSWGYRPTAILAEEGAHLIVNSSDELKAFLFEHLA